jgi:2-(1,2-epoxy-1,2-dihydrophenyl)acetyl-CoA isomerase
VAKTVQTHRDGRVARVVLNRPDALNAFDREMAVELADRLVPLALDQEVRAVIISGQGRAFCAGGDLNWVRSFPAGEAAALYDLAGLFHRSVVEIQQMGKPVFAALNGVAAGAGFSLALACDFRVMAENAVLRQAYTAAGLSIDGGGTFTLPRLVGSARALEIAAFDPVIGSQLALEWGLVNRVVAEGQAEVEARGMADDLINRSASSFAWSKRLLRTSFANSLEVQLEREREGIATCAGSPDGKEGIRAFAEKRQPVF